MNPSVSDHALLRWLERYHGVDIAAYRQELLNLALPAIEIRASTAPLPCGLWLLIKNDTVVTVTPDKPTSRLEPLVYEGPGKPHWKHATRRRFK